MMRRSLLFGILLPVLLASCRTNADSEKEVKRVAEQCYSYLLNGNYEAYVDAAYHAAPLRAEERAERIDNLKMFAAKEQEERKGIISAEASRAEVSLEDSCADVFLLLTYGDGTREQVLLPLVRRRGLWYLR